MSQHDYNLANQSGALHRTDLNNALGAIVTNNSGAAEPADMFAYMWWVDTATGWLKQRNSTNTAWIEVFQLATVTKQPVLSRSSNTILAGVDRGKLIRATSAFTQTLTAAATLGDGWWVDFLNDSSGDCTIDPDGTETIDGATTILVPVGSKIRIHCTGTAFFSDGTVVAANTVKAGSAGATFPALWVQGAAGNNRDIQFVTGASVRWIIRVTNETEAGASAGSNLHIQARTDSGTTIDTPIFMARAASGVGGISRRMALSTASSGVSSASLLDMNSTALGFRPPRMTTAQRNAITVVSADLGLMIFNTTTGRPNFWDSSSWQAL